ncbi:MAG TPA: beta-ketoacyl-ACP synthase III [Phototrophicaceae bacterium]|nr:beta-ketoacyl-ACP synthase III [Phototrophicaceae bacterium]
MPETLYAHIVGWGMAVPEKILTNEDLAAFIETSDDWIRTRTGIRERHIAGERDSTATLGLKAAQQALEVADILPTDIDMIIVATSTPEHIFPSAASLIQSWLGATKAGAFDLSAACSGFVYAVDMAAQAIRSGRIQTAVVIGAETMSRVMDWQDRATCILFGDGAGAVVLTASEVEGGVLSAVLRSDGSGGDLLGIPTVGSIDIGDIPVITNGYKFGKMHMNGSEVFKFATRVFGESINQALDLAGLTIKDLHLIVPHQANLRIIQAAARAMKLDESMFVSNVDRYGNTSAASIPIALCEAIEQGRIKANDYIAFIGFGGGLTWASMIVKWGSPQLEEHAVISFNKQRRQVSYTMAWWRARLSLFSHQLGEVIRRIRPERGRMDRLRRRMDQHDFQ